VGQQASAFLFKSLSPPGDGGRPQDLGSAEEVRQKISACFPTVDWSDPTFGIFEGEGFSFMFTMGEEETIESFVVCARGGIAFGPLRGLASRWGWDLFDFSQGE
jgi:hypothetical protein